MTKLALLLAAGGLVAAAPALALDAFTITYENAGVEHSTATFDVVGVETFDSRTTGFTSFTTDFGTSGAITGSYANVQVNTADIYGGAGGTGKYAVAFGATPYSVTLTSDPTRVPGGINYFGYYLSALDGGNVVQFYRGATLVGELDPTGVLAKIGSKPAYFGNPDMSGGNAGQPYAFVNFFDTNGTFDRIVFKEDPAVGGYESDNHTVGFFTATGGNTVPEPATWAMMIAGFGLVGASLRRRAAVAA